MEVKDGYKTIDISIPSAKIDIEVDGLHHFLEPEQIKSDFMRTYWSIKRDDYDTIHIPNIIIEKYLNKVADALASVARSHHEAIKEEEHDAGILGWIRRLFIK